MIISRGHAFCNCTGPIQNILLALVFQSENGAAGTLKSEKNLGYFSVLDPHKHSDIIHFHMLNWKGED